MQNNPFRRRMNTMPTRLPVLIWLLFIFLTCENPVEPDNRPPQITSPATAVAHGEEPFTYLAEADDPDDDPVSFAYTGLPDWLSITGDSAVGTPASAADSCRFTLIASDGHNGTDTLKVTVNVLPGPTDLLRELAGEIIAAVNLDTLQQFVRELSGEVPVAMGDSMATIASRHRNYRGNSLAAEYLGQRLGGYGLPVTTQIFSETGVNVLATQEGTEGSVANVGAYIVCAHYDCYPDSSLAPGADDNASGTALVLEAARILSTMTPRWPVIYALWDEEEQGLLGARYYAETARQSGELIRGVINIDMVGWDSNDDRVLLVNTRNLADTYDLSDTFVQVNNYYDIGLAVQLVDPGSGSDNVAFWYNGYSAIGVEEYYGEDWNSYYHTVEDRLNKFNLEYFHQACRAVIGTLATLAWIEEETPTIAMDGTP